MIVVKVMTKNGAFTLEQGELIKSVRHVDLSCHCSPLVKVIPPLR